MLAAFLVHQNIATLGTLASHISLGDRLFKITLTVSIVEASSQYPTYGVGAGQYGVTIFPGNGRAPDTSQLLNYGSRFQA